MVCHHLGLDGILMLRSPRFSETLTPLDKVKVGRLPHDRSRKVSSVIFRRGCARVGHSNMENQNLAEQECGGVKKAAKEKWCQLFAV